MSRREPTAQRYAAFLRGVSPMNCKMPELKRSFEAAGFTDVKTLLSSGNVVFTAPTTAEAALEQQAEAAMERLLDRSFMAIVRRVDALGALIASDPFQGVDVPAGTKRVVTFLKEPPVKRLALPIEIEGARIVGMKGSEVFTTYVPHPRGPVFMRLIEKTFGKDLTTRTWETVRKAAGA